MDSVEEAVDQGVIEELNQSLNSGGNNSDQLLSLLKRGETLLTKIAKSPDKPVQEALHLLKNTLVSDFLMHHENKEVKAGVAICIGEIFFIFAPNYPFNHISRKKLKDIYTVIASSFKIMSSSDVWEGSNVNFLLTMEKCHYHRGMVVLKLTESIGAMLEDFFEYLRSNHHNPVISGHMESIMIIIFDQLAHRPCKDVFAHLHKQLLSTLERSYEGVKPNDMKLVERVIQKCKRLNLLQNKCD